MGDSLYHINVNFTNDRFSRASLSNGNITMFVQNCDNANTIFMILVSFFTHEYTHLVRSKLGSYNYVFYKPNNDYEYFLNPEEMISFYNQIVVESYFRQCAFKKCLSNFIKHNISDPIVANRFYNGVFQLYTTKKFMAIKSENNKIALEVKNNLDKFLNYVNEWAELGSRIYNKEKTKQIQQDVYQKLSMAF